MSPIWWLLVVALLVLLGLILSQQSEMKALREEVTNKADVDWFHSWAQRQHDQAKDSWTEEEEKELM